jgi:hypothetical protein
MYASYDSITATEIFNWPALVLNKDHRKEGG